MYKNIVVAVGLSDDNLKTIQSAVELCREEGAITLVHVVERLEDEVEDLEKFYEKLAERGEITLGQWCADFSKAHCKVDKTILIGKRVNEILKYADSVEADLIVTGSHANTTVDPKSYGTLSHQLAMFANTSVLVVR